MYKKKGTKNKWTDEQLHEAVTKVKTKGTDLEGRRTGYPGVQSRCGVSSKRYGGGSTVLTSEEEREIVVTCQILAEMGFQLTKGDVEVVVRDYLKNQDRCSAFW